MKKNSGSPQYESVLVINKYQLITQDEMGPQESFEQSWLLAKGSFGWTSFTCDVTDRAEGPEMASILLQCALAHSTITKSGYCEITFRYRSFSLMGEI